MNPFKKQNTDESEIISIRKVILQGMHACPLVMIGVVHFHFLSFVCLDTLYSISWGALTSCILNLVSYCIKIKHATTSDLKMHVIFLLPKTKPKGPLAWKQHHAHHVVRPPSYMVHGPYLVQPTEDSIEEASISQVQTQIVSPVSDNSNSVGGSGSRFQFEGGFNGVQAIRMTLICPLNLVILISLMILLILLTVVTEPSVIMLLHS